MSLLAAGVSFMKALQPSIGVFFEALFLQAPLSANRTASAFPARVKIFLKRHYVYSAQSPPACSWRATNNMAGNSDIVEELSVTIKWSGKEYSIENLSPSDTVKSLKDLIKDKTGVLPERQKLLGLKYKGTV